MTGLKRKLTALLLALIFVAGTVAISGCKGDSTPTKKAGTTPTKKALPGE